MPLLQSKPGEVTAAVKCALEQGYTHVDCAIAYGNEDEVGQAIKEKVEDGTIKREDLFVTSKVRVLMRFPPIFSIHCRQSL